jgi:hypothetical protein
MATPRDRDIEIRVEELGERITADPQAFTLLVQGTLKAADEAGKQVTASSNLAAFLIEYMQ